MQKATHKHLMFVITLLVIIAGFFLLFYFEPGIIGKVVFEKKLEMPTNYPQRSQPVIVFQPTEEIPTPGLYCGNGICEKNKGENQRNCPRDCDLLYGDVYYGTAVRDKFFVDNPRIPPTPEELEKYRFNLKDLYTWGVTEDFGKMWSMHSEGRYEYSWSKIDATLDWFEANSMKLKYHFLCGYLVDKPGQDWIVPAWFDGDGLPEEERLSQEEKILALEEHVRAIVSRYRGRITMYDVFNEPVSHLYHGGTPDDIMIAQGESTNYMGTGLSILDAAESCFRWARNEDPNAVLLINEGFVLVDPEVRAAYIDFVKELLRRDIPIDGIGIQGHFGCCGWNHRLPPDDIINDALTQIADETGLPIFITEFDISPSSNDPNWPNYQAEDYERAYNLFSSHPKVAAVFSWGFYDKEVWLPGTGLFDTSFNPKPVYYTVSPILKSAK